MAYARIFLIDDHPLVLAGIQYIIDNEPDLYVAGSARNIEEAISGIIATAPDLAIVDLSLPDGAGTALIERLRLEFPELATMALTVHEDPSHVRQVLAAGARGYLVKRCAPAELIRAIRCILIGGRYIDPTVAARMIAPNGSSPGDPDVDPDILSGRERSVIQLVAQGYSNKEISSRLSVSVKTVETYRTRATDKLELRNRAAIVRYAQHNGWFAEMR